MEETQRKRQLEPEIKAATLNYLIKKGKLGFGQTVINEFTLDNYSRRADLVVASDRHLVAIEVKSEADSLHRLSGQTKKYLEYFDKVIIVAASKHIPNIIETVPKQIAVWEINKNQLRIRQRGKIAPVKDKTKFIGLMTANELLKLSTKLDLPLKARNRRSAEETLKNAPLSKLKQAALESIQERYALTVSAFWKEIEDNKVSPENIELLSPYTDERKAQKSKKLFWDNFSTRQNEDIYFKEMAKRQDNKLFGKPPEHIQNLLTA